MKTKWIMRAFVLLGCIFPITLLIFAALMETPKIPMWGQSLMIFEGVFLSVGLLVMFYESIKDGVI